MSLYNQIKKYTKEGKLVVTKEEHGYNIYNQTNFGNGVKLMEAVRCLANMYYTYDENTRFYGQTLLGFYNPDTGEVEAIEEEKEFKLGDRVKSHDGIEGIIDAIDKYKQLIAVKADKYYYYVESQLTLIETKKGFDPEALTFDGVEIKEGDYIKCNNHKIKFKVKGLRLLFAEHNKFYFPLVALNIQAHYPQQSELEKAEEELKKAREEIDSAFSANNPHLEIEDENWALDRYYKARQTLDTLKNNQ